MKEISEGMLYKTLAVFDRVFEIRYGYYEEFERDSKNCEPVPIYPDFRREPLYTKDGRMFVTKFQEICAYGSSRFKDGCCADCPHYIQGEEMIGVCNCAENRRVDE